jgi:hypothetical protein
MWSGFLEVKDYNRSKDKRWGITVWNCTETWDLTDYKAEPKLTSTLPGADTAFYTFDSICYIYIILEVRGALRPDFNNAVCGPPAVCGSVVHCNAMQCTALHCNAMQCPTVLRYSAQLLCRTTTQYTSLCWRGILVLCSAVQCSAVQCSAILSHYDPAHQNMLARHISQANGSPLLIYYLHY